MLLLLLLLVGVASVGIVDNAADTPPTAIIASNIIVSLIDLIARLSLSTLRIILLAVWLHTAHTPLNVTIYI